MKSAPNTQTIEEYIASYPASTQVILNKIRMSVREALPEATEKMSYGIPTFWQKRNLVHYGAYPKHIGYYPGAAAIEAFKDQLTDFETSKGTIRFPLDQPIPYELIKSIAQYNLSSIK